MSDKLQLQLEELLRQPPPALAQPKRMPFDAIASTAAPCLVLFGAGPLGRRTLAGLRRLGIEPLAFADNKAALWHQSVDGLQVLSPLEAVHRFAAQAVFVVTIFNPSGTVQQLHGLGCARVASFASLYWKYPTVLWPYGENPLPPNLHDHAADIRRMYSLWADDGSRREYVAQLQWRSTQGAESLPAPLSSDQLYFPSDVVQLAKDEVFVDCGAFDGDTVRSLLARTGNSFRRIVALEPDPINYQNLQRFVSTLAPECRAKITIQNAAVGSRKETLHFEGTGTMGSGVRQAGPITVECVPLDEALDGLTPTYVKMDIEGAEPAALAGARRIIGQNSAVWAICLYHQQEHLWQIPLFLASISDGYRYFLRRYAEDCWELVCYAIPHHRLATRS